MTAESLLVSVVVPTHNRPERLRKCVAALAAQRYPREAFEVIVVDDGSRHPVDDLLAPFGKDVRLMILRQTNAGPATARNHGASRAAGELLAFTDDDCEPGADWLALLWTRHQQAPDAAIGGRTINALVHNARAEASQALVDYLYSYYGEVPAAGLRSPAAGPATARLFTSNNLAVPAALFRGVGGFDLTFPLAAGEDREFCDRWNHAGYGFVYEPGAVVWHAHALSLAGFWRQHFHYGRGAWHFRAARRRREAADVGIEPLAFYRDLVLHPLRTGGVVRGGRVAALLTLAQVANAAGFWRERIAAGRARAPRSTM